MVHTVGIFGVNGNVGAPTAKLLSKAAEEGKINLIIFHREGSTPKGLSKGANIESRTLSYDDPPEKLEAAIKGVNFFISAVGFAGLSGEPNLVDALAKSPDLVSFMPSSFSTTWDSKDYDDPYAGPVLKFIRCGWDRAIEKGVGVTTLYIGCFENYWFEYGFVGAPIKQNQVWANEKQLKNKVPITHLSHLAAAITHIATSDLQSVRNQSFSAVTFWPTGQELVDLYTRLNQKPATVKPWTNADRDAMNADTANFGAAKVGYWDRWENASFSYDADGKKALGGYDGPELEEVAKTFL